MKVIQVVLIIVVFLPLLTRSDEEERGVRHDMIDELEEEAEQIVAMPEETDEDLEEEAGGDEWMSFMEDPLDLEPEEEDEERDLGLARPAPYYIAPKEKDKPRPKPRPVHKPMPKPKPRPKPMPKPMPKPKPRPTPPKKYFYLRNYYRRKNKCVDFWKNSYYPRKARLVPCDKTSTKFEWRPGYYKGYYKLYIASGSQKGKCFDSYYNGARKCMKSRYQEWYKEEWKNGWYWLSDKKRGKYLDVYDKGHYVKMNEYDDDSYTQLWKFKYHY